MLEKAVRKGAEAGSEVEKMIIILKVRSWYAEEGLPGDKLKNKAAKAPDIKSRFDCSGQDQLWGSKAERGDDLFWRTREKVC